MKLEKNISAEGPPVATVIIPSYNRPALLKRAIKSVLAQSFQNFELIVVDDGSKHRLAEVESHFSDTRLRFIKHSRNRGGAAARNTGVRRSSGKYIAFLDDDDEWLPSKLEKQIDLFERLSLKYGLVYCWMAWISNGQVIKTRKPELRGNLFDYVLATQPLGNCSTWIVRRSVFQRAGYFDDGLPRGIDGDFMRRVAQHFSMDFVPEILVRYHVGHVSPRITRSDETGTRDAITSEKIKLKRFRKELAIRPRELAIIYKKISFHYARLGDFHMFINYQVKALVQRLRSFGSALSSVRRKRKEQ